MSYLDDVVEHELHDLRVVMNVRHDPFVSEETGIPSYMAEDIEGSTRSVMKYTRIRGCYYKGKRLYKVDLYSIEFLESHSWLYSQER